MREKINCEFLVAGGGFSGICAAVQAGRLGMNTIIVEKEMILGGNGGPNLGVGATAVMSTNPYWNETGIVEELEERVSFQKARTNPTNFGYTIHPQWDDVVTRMLTEAGVTILRKHLFIDTKMNDDKIVGATLINIENLDQIEVVVDGYVLDATGDAFVAKLSGANFRMGRESRLDTKERSAPLEADNVISTASITALVVNTGVPNEFIAPEGTPLWNPEKPDNHFDPSKNVHFLWQVDEGGEDESNHSLYTPQELYRKLVYRIYSVWHYLKNVKYPEETKCHQLVWIAPILGRRESRRIEGDYLLTQVDIEECKIFEDVVGFGGHFLDEHMPSYDGGYEVKFYSKPLPFDIPFRSIYSNNITNLLSGGRAIGVSHLAFTSTRLMRTGGALGQVSAIAAKLCIDKGISLRALANEYSKELHQEMLRNDAFCIGPVNEDANDKARNAKISASSEGSLSRNKTGGEWENASNIVSAAIFDYPQNIEKVDFYIRNKSNNPVIIKGFLAYGEAPKIQLMPVPEFKYNPITKVYDEIPVPKGLPGSEWINKEVEIENNDTAECNPTGTAGWAEYYMRNDKIMFYEIKSSKSKTIEAGFEGFVAFEFDYNDGFPKFDRSKTGQAVVLGVVGNVELLVAPHKVDVVEGLVGESGKCATDLKNIPVFKISPDHLPGKAENIINGYIHRYGRAKLNQWMSAPEEKLPQWIQLDFEDEISINSVEIKFDTTERLFSEMYLIKGDRAAKRLISEYKVEALTEGGWKTIVTEKENHLRFRTHKITSDVKAKALKLTAIKTWGEGEPARVYEIRVY